MCVKHQVTDLLTDVNKVWQACFCEAGQWFIDHFQNRIGGSSGLKQKWHAVDTDQWYWLETIPEKDYGMTLLAESYSQRLTAPHLRKMMLRTLVWWSQTFLRLDGFMECFCSPMILHRPLCLTRVSVIFYPSAVALPKLCLLIIWERLYLWTSLFVRVRVFCFLFCFKQYFIQFVWVRLCSLSIYNNIDIMLSLTGIIMWALIYYVLVTLVLFQGHTNVCEWCQKLYF